MTTLQNLFLLFNFATVLGVIYIKGNKPLRRLQISCETHFCVKVYKKMATVQTFEVMSDNFSGSEN